MEMNQIHLVLIQFGVLDFFSQPIHQIDKKDMAYVSAYAELCKSIDPKKYNKHIKLLNLDHKPFKGNVMLPGFLKKKDQTVIAVYRRDSAKRFVKGILVQ